MMILVCPECSTNYEIPNALPDEGAKVRCTTCEHIWLATPADTFDPNDQKLEEETQADEQEGELAASAGGESEALEESSALDEEVPAISPGEEEFDELDFSEVPTDENSQSDIDDLFDEPAAVEEEPAGEASLASLFDDDAADEEGEVAAAPEEDAGNSQDDIDGLFDEPGDDNSQDDIDGLFDADDGDEGNSQGDIDGLFDEAETAGEEGQSQDDIDGLFDEEPAVAAAPENEPADDVASDEDLVDPFEGADFGEEENPVLAADDSAKLPIWKRMSHQAVVGWSCYFIALVLVMILAVSLRVHVVRVAPAMASIYKALGMPVNVRGVMFTNVQQRWQPIGGKLQLQVEGEVANLTNSYKTLPHIVVGALSEDRREVFRWVVNVRKKPLLPGEKAPFVAEIPAPPEYARHLVLRFQE